MHDLARTADGISRREALRRASLVLGGAVLLGQGAWLAGCAQSPETVRGETLFSAEEIALLDEVAETILPATSTPGARAAAVGSFIALMVTDTYSPRAQQTFREGLTELQRQCRIEHDRDFMAASPEQRHALLVRLDQEQPLAVATAPPEDTPWFRMIKQLTVLGYFTSEIGCTQAQRYIETPGRYDPCAPLEAGERSWAPHA